jgi:Skp family chaperone for outer membrane proteins
MRIADRAKFFSEKRKEKNMMRKREFTIGVFLICFFVILGGKRAGADLKVKIGYVDIQKVFEGYQKTRDLRAKLQSEYKEKQEALKEQVESQKREIDALKENLLRQEAMLLPSEKEEKQKEIEEKMKELQALSQFIQDELRKKEQEIYKKWESLYLPEIKENISTVTKEIAVKEGYRFIFYKEALLYVTPEVEFDLTEKVLSQLNQKYQATRPQKKEETQSEEKGEE